MTSSGTKENLDEENGPCKKMDVIGSLPVEISQRVFLNLTPEDVRCALRCNTKWNNRMRGDYFWKEKCKINNVSERSEFLSSKIYDKFIEVYPNYWQSVYMYNEALSRNWKNTKYKESGFKCEKNIEIIYCVDDEFVIFGSFHPPEILFYSHKLKKITKTFLVGDMSDWNKIIRTQNYLIYTDRINYLCLWDIEKETLLLKRILTPGYRVVDIDVYKNLLGVTFMSGLFCIFNIDSGKTEYTTSSPSVRFHSFANERVAFASDDHSIRLMNLQDKSVTEIECCEKTRYLQDVKLLADHLISSCGQIEAPYIRNFCVWKIGTSNHKLVHRIMNFHYKYSVFHVGKINRVILQTTGNKELEVWDFSRTGLHLFTINCGSFIWSVCLNDFCVVVCTNALSEVSRESVTKVWCIETGKFISLLSVSRSVYFIETTNTKLVILDKRITTDTNYLSVLDFEKLIKLK